VLTSVCFRVRLVDPSKRGEVGRPRRESARERERESELGIIHNGGSRAAGGQRTPMDFQKSAGEGTNNYFSTLFVVNDTPIITM